MDKWGYNYLNEQKTLWEKEKLLLTSNFSFSQNVFKSCLLFMRENEYLWSKGLNISVVLWETTLTISGSLEAGSPVQTEILRVVSLSTMGNNKR